MKRKRTWLPLVVLSLASLAYFLPLLIHPDWLINRNNDLRLSFWPWMEYTKHSILTYHQIPLWNNMYLSGTPFLANPQAPIFYLPNIIFLIMPIGIGFLLSTFLHLVLAGIGMYYLSRWVFKLSFATSLISGFVYLATPKIAGFMEAGHFGLVIAYAFLPWLALSGIKLVDSPKAWPKWLFVISLLGLFLSHTVTFFWAVVSILVIQLLKLTSVKDKKQAVLRILLSFLIFAGLSAMVALPQAEYLPFSTRSLLLQNRDVYPKWTSKTELIIMSVFPYLHSRSYLQSVDTEQWIASGIVLALLASLAFLKLTRKNQLLLVVSLGICVLIALNNASPIYRFLLKIDFYVLNRISTRLWFIPLFMMIILGAGSLDRLVKHKFWYGLVVSLLVLETVGLSWLRLSRPEQPKAFFPLAGIKFIKQDTDLFRVFCLTKCISQKDVAENQLETVEGYDTIQQLNYLHHAWQLTNSYWGYYSLNLPPEGIIRFKQIQPNADDLGAYNVKYVIAPYTLTDNRFKLLKQFDDFKVYQNSAFLPRVYYNQASDQPTILSYTPNYIQIRLSYDAPLVIANVYSQGWKAYAGNTQIPVQETPSALQLVDIPTGSQTVVLRYKPDSFTAGQAIFGGTLLTIVGWWLIRKYRPVVH